MNVRPLPANIPRLPLDMTNWLATMGERHAIREWGGGTIIAVSRGNDEICRQPAALDLFFFPARGQGVRGNRISRLSGPQPRGSSGGWARNWEELQVFNQAALQDSDFIGNDIGMKNKNNKTEINRRQPRAFKHLQGGGRMERNGNFLHLLHQQKGSYCLQSWHVVLWYI